MRESPLVVRVSARLRVNSCRPRRASASEGNPPPLTRLWGRPLGGSSICPPMSASECCGHSEIMSEPESAISAVVSGGRIEVEPFFLRIAGPVTVSLGDCRLLCRCTRCSRNRPPDHRVGYRCWHCSTDSASLHAAPARLDFCQRRVYRREKAFRTNRYSLYNALDDNSAPSVTPTTDD